MKIRLLNLLIALAIAANLWYGWKLGTLYSTGPDPAFTGQNAGSGEIRLSVPGLPGSGRTDRKQEEMEELNRRISGVVRQLQKMNLPEDTVLIIRPEGPARRESAGSAMNAGLIESP